MTAVTQLQIIAAALKRIGVLAAGETPSAVDQQDCSERLQGMIDGFGTQRLTIYYTPRITHTLTANVQTYTIGVSGAINQPRPLWIPYAGIVLTTPSPDVEIPLEILTEKDWALKSIKALTSTIPTQLYYDYNWSAGLALITLWPTPTEVNDLALYLPRALQEFADLSSTTYTFPPGYQRMLINCLAVELAPEYGRPVDPQLQKIATDAMADIKRANIRLTDLSIDPALTQYGGGRFNWRTGEMGPR